MNFPDLPHLRQLQNDLWRWPRARAAVMVGAGLSLNSDTLPGVHSKFPTWRDLVWAMFEELHPPLPGAQAEQANERLKRFQQTNPLRIASEYEAAFGRNKLDLLIQHQNPDADHVPGSLHRMLMELPWADVFTTNYDTLLERTDVPGRSYQPVTKATELTSAFAPRIIKLHGSFPSQTPFIITEDDYRKYPAKFAPFVNSVQQSLIENAFVLIGFSGDDPNFLAWTGWIRDHLGEHHAPIYLVGPLGIGPAERALLTRRGVTPIDLSPVFAGINVPEGIHAASLRWFLQCLQLAKPARPEKWPESDFKPLTSLPGMPPLIGPSVMAPERASTFPDPQKPLMRDVVAELLLRWQYERSQYQHWVAAPEGMRSEVWSKTKYWIRPLCEFAKEWPAGDRLLLFREINWRLETAMVPLFPESIEPFGSAVSEFFVGLKEGRRVEATQKDMPWGKSSPREIEDSWFELAFALLREARETYKIARWDELKSQIDTVIGQHTKHHDRNSYETILWSLWKIERDNAKVQVTSWQPSMRNPLAVMWKAGVLAELDELSESRSLLRGALVEIRRAQNTQGRNIELLSLEGWCSFLLFGVEQVLDVTCWEALRKEFAERWHELKAWDCSPWPLKDFIDDALKSPPPAQKKAQTRTHRFDPGLVTVTHHLGGDDIDDYLPAFACIRLYEQVGLPMRMRMLNLGTAALTSACRWLKDFLGFASPAILIRAGNLPQITSAYFMSRTQVALMEGEVAARLYDLCLPILQRELESLKGTLQPNSPTETLLEVLPEVLSRMAFRMEAKVLTDSLQLAIRFHFHPSIRAHIRLHETSASWFMRLFLAAECDLLTQWLPSLLRQPLYEDGVNQLLSTGQSWPDPMTHFPADRLRDAKDLSLSTNAQIKEAADWLLLRVESEEGEAQWRAEQRVFKLHEAELLTTEQLGQLGILLWRKKDIRGLPEYPHLRLVSFLMLPAPPNEDVEGKIKKCLLEAPLQCAVAKDKSGNLRLTRPWHDEPVIYEVAVATTPLIQLRDESRGILTWTASEAQILLQRVLQWWDTDKATFEIMQRSGSFGTFGAEHIFKTLELLPQFLARAVLQHKDCASEIELARVLELFADLRAHGVFPTIALPYVLIHRPTELRNISNTLADDMAANSEERIVAATRAVRHWAHLAHNKHVPELPSHFIPQIVRRVVFREPVGLQTCISVTTKLLLETPEAFSKGDVDWLAGSLSSWHRVLRLEKESESVDEFDGVEKPDLRVLIGRLASALKYWFDRANLEDTEQLWIKIWQDTCEKDPLPEVRRSFDYSHEYRGGA